MRCDVVMVVWNQVPMTRTALASLHRHAGFPYRLILVDNSDEPAARQHFRDIAASGEFGETLLIQNDANLGWLKATNLGLRRADAEFVCLLNNDVVCGPDWLRQCIDLMAAHPDIGLVNPRGNERSEKARARNDVNAFAAELAAKYQGLFTELDHCSGFCMVVRKAILDRVGLLDEIFEGGHFEDDDLSRRAQRLGYRCAQCDSAFVFHIGGQSFRRVPEERMRLIKRNGEIHRRRWGTIRGLLVAIRAPDIAADELIELIRNSRVYLVRNRHVPPEVLAFRHQHLTLLENRWLWEPLYFAWQAIYLSWKRRIDEARLIYRGSR